MNIKTTYFEDVDTFAASPMITPMIILLEYRQNNVYVCTLFLCTQLKKSIKWPSNIKTCLY